MMIADNIFCKFVAFNLCSSRGIFEVFVLFLCNLNNQLYWVWPVLMFECNTVDALAVRCEAIKLTASVKRFD